MNSRWAEVYDAPIRVSTDMHTLQYEAIRYALCLKTMNDIQIITLM